jgi:hypothetical protein
MLQNLKQFFRPAYPSDRRPGAGRSRAPHGRTRGSWPGFRALTSRYNKKSFIYCPGGKTLIWRKTARLLFRYKETIGLFPKATNDKVIYG